MTPVEGGLENTSPFTEDEATSQQPPSAESREDQLGAERARSRLPHPPWPVFPLAHLRKEAPLQVAQVLALCFYIIPILKNSILSYSPLTLRHTPGLTLCISPHGHVSVHHRLLWT